MKRFFSGLMTCKGVQARRRQLGATATGIMTDILLLVIIGAIAVTIYVTLMIPQFNSWLGADSSASGMISLVKLGFGIAVALAFVIVGVKGFHDIKG